MNNFEMSELSQLMLESYTDLVDSRLEKFLKNKNRDVEQLTEAMSYSVTATGKRLRPVLALEFCRISGGNTDNALPLACAIEMIHASSLIHDDLPCMDDDDLRRGQPSCHKKYGESTALLAGDALEAKAFEIACEAPVEAETAVKCICLLAESTGPNGMLGGQILDMQNESMDDIDLKRLANTHNHKTGALIKCACQLGVLAGGGSAEMLEAAGKFGMSLGLAFQIQDDILDVTGSTEVLGKKAGSDEADDKTTYVTLLGLDKAREMAKKSSLEALKSLDAFEDNKFLKDLTFYLLDRNK